jgi:beta-lactamase class A
MVKTSLMSTLEGISKSFSGRLSVSANNLTTGEQLGMREAEVFPSISTIKLGIMAEMFYRIEAGDLALADKVTIKESDLRGGTGVFREFKTPVEVTLEDVCMMMIVVSDNTCTWLLNDILGKQNINDRMRSLGLQEYSLNSDLGPDMFEEFKQPGKGIEAYSECSARDFTRLISLIANGELVSPAASDRMLDMMGRCQHIEWLGRYLPLSPYSEELGVSPKVKLHNKLGAGLGARCDAGLITTPSTRYVITVMTADSTDPSRLLCSHEGSRTIGRVSEAVFNDWAEYLIS